MDSYFLGGKSLPFYMLGLSNASGMFDITGNNANVYTGHLLMVSKVFVLFMAVFNQIFLMVHLSVWAATVRTFSTGAEWIKTRFGKGKGSTLSHTIVNVSAL